MSTLQVGLLFRGLVMATLLLASRLVTIGPLS